jgi:hypothetical protein
MKEAVPVKIIEESGKIDWDGWVLLVATFFCINITYFCLNNGSF